MFRAKTLFVVGAGASVEVGLPTGAALLKSIVDLFNITFEYGHQQKTGDRLLVDALRLHLNEGREVTKLNEHLQAGRQLRQSAAQALSIDNVIDALENPCIELVGKMGIVRAILKAEFASANFKVRQDRQDWFEAARFADTWYSSFTKLLTENVKKSQIDDIFENIEIINFNYDRCIEHYLPESISSYYGVSSEEIQQLMQKLVIHRPYGSVGRLPWQKGNGPSIRFGECSAQQLSDVAQQIRTFTERVEDEPSLQALKHSVAKADRIVFLGFAFHRQNVELLAQQIQAHTEILATAYEISASDREVIGTEIEKAFEFETMVNDGKLHLADMDCRTFFKEYWRTLTADRSYDDRLDILEGIGMR